MHSMHAYYACMLCMHIMHAYYACMHTMHTLHACIHTIRTRAETSDALAESGPDHRSPASGGAGGRFAPPICGLGLILLECRWFLRACARACVLYVCMRAEYAWYACMQSGAELFPSTVCMRAYVCMHMYACICMHVYVCMHVCLCMYVYVCMFMYACICIRA